MLSKFGDTVSFKISGNKTLFLTVYEIVYRNAPVYTLVYGKLKCFTCSVDFYSCFSLFIKG